MSSQSINKHEEPPDNEHSWIGILAFVIAEILFSLLFCLSPMTALIGLNPWANERKRLA